MSVDKTVTFHGPVSIVLNDGATPQITWATYKREALGSMNIVQPTIDEELADGSKCISDGAPELTFEITSDEFDSAEIALVSACDELVLTFAGNSDTITIDGLDGAGANVHAEMEGGKTKLVIKKSGYIGQHVDDLVTIAGRS